MALVRKQNAIDSLLMEEKDKTPIPKDFSRYLHGLFQVHSKKWGRSTKLRGALRSRDSVKNMTFVCSTV
jgi:hypothetical protein